MSGDWNVPIRPEYGAPPKRVPNPHGAPWHSLNTITFTGVDSWPTAVGTIPRMKSRLPFTLSRVSYATLPNRTPGSEVEDVMPTRIQGLFPSALWNIGPPE